MPDFQHPADASLEEMQRDLDMLFQLFDHVEWLQFVGGEIFLHKDLAAVLRYCKQFARKFDRLILETNATMLPSEEVFSALSEQGRTVKVMISDYGTLSRRRAAMLERLDELGLDYVLKPYYGDNQHFGGWIDNTACRDLQEPEEEVVRKAALCPQVRLENMHCWRGKLHRCSNSLFLSELGLFQPNERDVLSLHDSALSLEEKRRVIEDFYKTPRRSCRFCRWKDADSLPRFPAAEQAVREKVEAEG